MESARRAAMGTTTAPESKWLASDRIRRILHPRSATQILQMQLSMLSWLLSAHCEWLDRHQQGVADSRLICVRPGWRRFALWRDRGPFYFVPLMPGTTSAHGFLLS